MKNFVLFILLSFFSEGVFGDSVSVTDGDSVTLHTGLTEIQEDDVLEWRFGAGRDRIARVRKGSNPTTYDDVPDGRFRGRLKLDGQTGDLTITNITTEHAGPYNMSINAIDSRIFSVIGVSGVDEVKSVSLIVGDSVTLNSGTNIQRDDVIEWRFGDLNSLIAENNRKTGDYSTSDGPDGRFRERLQLDYTTGSLTIRNTRTEHAGVYEAGIRKSSSTHTIHKSYSVTASGERKSVSVMKGYSVTLHTNLTEIQTTDLMQWMFEGTVLAEINKAQQRFSTYDDPDERFRDRLKLDKKTGSLTIMNTTYTHSGLYELKIFSSRFIINKRIHVTVTDPGLSTGAIVGIVLAGLLACAAVVVVFWYHHHIFSKLEKQASELEGEAIELNEKVSELIEQVSELNEQEWLDKGKILSVMEGERINLIPDEVHKDGKLQWMFRGSCIAERKSAADRFTVNDGDLKGRLELDHKTGSLTITDTKNTDSGEYQLLILTRLGNISIKKFRVSVFPQTIEIETMSVEEGESVTLKTDVTADIMEDGQTQWLLGYTPLATIKGGTKTFSPSAAVIFKGRLKLDDHTVSLTIKKIRPTDAGIYRLYKIGPGTNINTLFKVEVLDSTDNINKPKEESVTINNPEEEPLRSVDSGL